MAANKDDGNAPYNSGGATPDGDITNMRIIRDGVIVLDCKQLGTDDAFLLQELLIQIWKERGWPLREMGLERWESLTHSLITVSETSKRFEFPGQIRGDYANGCLQLSAPQDDAPAH